MINVCTVHWLSAEWIEPQVAYLRRHLQVPFRLYGVLNGLEEADAAPFHYAADLEGTHSEKLNALAQIASSESSPDDPLVFLDGDAFPIKDLTAWVPDVLSKFPLIAVQRTECLGDPQPHPSFCLTTVGFWNEIQGDWRPGHTWINTIGDRVTDVGGNLLLQLEDRGIEWLPLRRTNTNDLHPIWYGIYGHRVYHHGAGFRQRLSRVDISEGPDVRAATKTISGDPRRLLRPRRGDLQRLRGALAKSYKARSVERQYLEQVDIGDDLFKRILVDPDFYREFDDAELNPAD
jgi:hypothetical protein